MRRLPGLDNAWLRRAMRLGRPSGGSVLALMLALMLAGCGTRAVRFPSQPAQDTTASTSTAPEEDGMPPASEIPADVADIPDAIPQPAPRSQRGNPPDYTVLGKTYKVRGTAAGFTQVGYASWYGKKFQGRLTSSGQPYDMFKMTAAHKTLPIPSYVRVTDLANGKSVVVRINDRGPFHKGRIIDLSYVAALKLGMVKHGTAKVRIKVLSPAAPESPSVPPDSPTGGLQEVAMRGSALPADGVAHKFLQVGVFAQPDNAKAMRDRLQSVGASPIRMVKTEYDGKPAMRVLVGPLETAQRDKLRARLAHDGIASIPESP